MIVLNILFDVGFTAVHLHNHFAEADSLQQFDYLLLIYLFATPQMIDCCCDRADFSLVTRNVLNLLRFWKLLLQFIHTFGRNFQRQAQISEKYFHLHQFPSLKFVRHMAFLIQFNLLLQIFDTLLSNLASIPYFVVLLLIIGQHYCLLCLFVINLHSSILFVFI